MFPAFTKADVNYTTLYVRGYIGITLRAKHFIQVDKASVLKDNVRALFKGNARLKSVFRARFQLLPSEPVNWLRAFLKPLRTSLAVPTPVVSSIRNKK